MVASTYSRPRRSFNGIPDEGTFIINTCGPIAASQWFVDPTPRDSLEFTGLIANAFSGFAQVGSPAVGQTDLYSLVAHEVGIHLLGIAQDEDFLWEDRWEDGHPSLSLTGLLDASVALLGPPGAGTGASVPGTLWRYDGGGVEALFSTNNGCTGVNSVDSAFPLHVAMPANANQFTSNGTTYFGVRDIGNPCLTAGLRTVPSLLLSRTLAEVYGYSIIPHDSFPTFYSHLDAAGNLLIRGGSIGEGFYTPTGQSNDTFHLQQVGDNLKVEVDIGIDVPGTGVGSFTSTFPLSSINSITILGHDGTASPGPDGDDVVTLNLSDGNWIPNGGINVDGGTGTNSLHFIGQSKYLIDGNSITVGNDASGVGYTNMSELIVSMDVSNANNSAVVANTPPSLQSLRIFGGQGIDRFEVESLHQQTSAVLTGHGNDDILIFAPTPQTLDQVLGQ